MKEMIKKVRERREGFTMAELLIVVVIIAVLVAIAIPVFNAQLEKSRQATDLANLRSAYAEASANYLTDGSETAVGSSGKYKIQHTDTNWTIGSDGIANLKISGTELEEFAGLGTGDEFYVKYTSAGATVER